jgi:hypothetical protein
MTPDKSHNDKDGTMTTKLTEAEVELAERYAVAIERIEAAGSVTAMPWYLRRRS